MAPKDYDGIHGPDRMYESLPDWVKDKITGTGVYDDEPPDTQFQELFGDLFTVVDGRVDYDAAEQAHDDLQDWMRRHYEGLDLDDYFMWDDWRENYNASA